MKRYTVLVAAVLMQMCLGATYSWSVYVRPLRELTGLLQGPAQLPFAVFYFVFPAVTVLAGTLLPRLGRRRCAVAGGVLFGAGWLVASLGGVDFGLTVLGIGGIAGVGAGLAYIVPISTCILWFPERRGLVTGVAVAGFGGGAALVSQVAGRMLADGATPFDAFRWFGAAFLLVVALSGLAMADRPGAPDRETGPLPLRDVLPRRAFRLLYLAMLVGLAAGFAVNANLKELFPSSASRGVTAVSLFALGNAAGRVAWGGLFDRTAAGTAACWNLFAQAALFAAGPWLVESAGGFLAFSLLSGINYGGVLVLYASSTARVWGNGRVGQVYGWLFSANIPAALAPVAAGLIYDRAGTFTPALAGLALLLAAAGLWLARNAGHLAAAPVRAG